VAKTRLTGVGTTGYHGLALALHAQALLDGIVATTWDERTRRTAELISTGICCYQAQSTGVSTVAGAILKLIFGQIPDGIVVAQTSQQRV